MAIKEPTKQVIDYEKIKEIVDEWLEKNTFSHTDYSNIGNLVDQKEQRKISVVFPTLNEEETIGNVVHTIKSELCDKYDLVDEILVVDSGSTNNTKQEAVNAGAKFFLSEDHLKEQGIHRGKGENLWTSLYVSEGDIIIWIDADIKNINSRFAYGLIGPLLEHDYIKYSKAFYERPIEVTQDSKKILAKTGGGRVTELNAKPLISGFFPMLSGFIQPLSGEYGGKREVLETVPFYNGYAVEMGLLIDIWDKYGLDAMAQVDLERREHRNQKLPALKKMSYGIMKAVLEKAEEAGKIVNNMGFNGLFSPVNNLGTFSLDEEKIENVERPPMITLEGYMKKFHSQ